MKSEPKRIVDARTSHLSQLVLPVIIVAALVSTVKASVSAAEGDWSSMVIIGSLGLFYYASVVLVHCTKRLTLPHIELLCVLTTVFVMLHDFITEGQYEIWLWLLLVTDVLFICGARPLVSRLTCLCSLVYIIIAIVDQAFGSVHLYTKTTNAGTRWFVSQLMIRGSVFIGNYYLLHGVGERAFHLLYISHAVAIELAKFNIDAAEYLLLDPKLAQGDLIPLRNLVVNLRKYKPYLPHIMMASPLLETNTSVSLSEKRHLALLYVKMTRGHTDRTLLDAIADRAKVWGGWMQNFDTESAMILFGVGKQDAFEGVWGSVGAGLTVHISQCSATSTGSYGTQSEPEYILKSVGDRFTRDTYYLTKQDIDTAPPGNFIAQYGTQYGDGYMWISLAPLMGEPKDAYIEIWMDGVSTRPGVNGKRICLKRSEAMISCATQCALAIRDHAQTLSDFSLRQVVVHAECIIAVAPEVDTSPESIELQAISPTGATQVSGDGMELITDIMDISTAQPMGKEEWEVVCSECTAGAVASFGAYARTEEIHAGPEYDGPVFSISDTSLISQRTRQELILYDSLPANREVPLQQLSPPSTWTSLGKGKAGEVWLGRCSKTQANYAIKELRFQEDAPSDRSWDTHQRLMFLKELLLLNDFRHERIVNFFGHSVSPDGNLYLLTEHCPKGTLQQAVYGADLSDRDRAEILLTMGEQISQALGYIHERGKAHMDTAARNVFISEASQYKLGDLGMVRDIGTKGAVICFPWAAPEALCCESKDRCATSEYDVWSFGMLCYEVLAGKAPYAGVPLDVMKAQIARGEIPNLPESVGRNHRCKEIWDKVGKFCLLKNPKARPLMSEITNTFKYTLRQDSVDSFATEDDVTAPLISQAFGNPTVSPRSTLGRQTTTLSCDTAATNPYSSEMMYAVDDEAFTFMM